MNICVKTKCIYGFLFITDKNDFFILLFFVVLAYLLAAQLKSGVYERHLQWVDDKLEIHSFPCLIDSPFGIEPWLRDKFCIMKLQRGNRELTDSDPLLLP